MLDKGQDGYEIITSYKMAYVLTLIKKGKPIESRKFDRRVYDFGDVLAWLNAETRELHGTHIHDKEKLGAAMLTPTHTPDAVNMAVDVFWYVMRVVHGLGFSVFSFDDVMQECPLLSTLGVDKALALGEREGYIVKVDGTHYKTRRKTRISEALE